MHNWENRWKCVWIIFGSYGFKSRFHEACPWAHPANRSRNSNRGLMVGRCWHHISIKTTAMKTWGSDEPQNMFIQILICFAILILVPPPSEHQHGGGLPRLTPWCMDVRFVTLSESHQMLWWDMVGNHAHAIQSISKRNNLPSWMIVVNPGQAWGETTSKAGQSNCPALQQRHRSPAGRGLRAPIAYT